MLILLVIAGRLQAADAEPAAHWKFDTVRDNKVLDSATGRTDKISGKYRLADGIKGRAIVMDGYTTCIVRSSELAPKLGKAFALEAWIAIGAYPWNWAPIVAQENTVSANSNLDKICWPDDITAESPKEGFFFGIGPQGSLGLQIGAGRWNICRSETRIPLCKWTHVAAVFDEKAGITLFINGQETARMKIGGGFDAAHAEELRIGRPRQKIEPSHPCRPFATFPCWYSLDGLLDELRVYSSALSAKTIAEIYASSRPDMAPDLPARTMPSGPPGKGKFGASYMNLQYYPEWDALWRVSSDPDVVVQFDDSPVRVVFWRGTRYGPAWVMENGMWMGDQSVENFNGSDGCIEHMLDPRCRFSHVRIIENTPARAVVHWRYCPVAANGNHSRVNPVSGWEDWVDEYYTFYPDQVGLRKVVFHSDGEPSLHPDAIIPFCQPGQRPEDVIELDAMTLANLNGKQHTYSWDKQSPKIRTAGRWERGSYIHFGEGFGEIPNIIMINLKSKYKPFQIFEMDCNFTVYAHEHRKDVSNFPWWNHWPAAMVPSDGRYCQAADRPSHFCLAWAQPIPHKGPKNTYWWTWMYGATRNKIGSLTSLARSWSRPPELVVQSGASESKFDSTQRCYVIAGSKEEEIDNLKFSLQADSDSPVVNPAFVVKNWGDHNALLKVNGKKVPRGKTFRIGHIRRINQYDLVAWLELQSNTKTEISMEHSK